MEALLTRRCSANAPLERLPDGTWLLQEGDDLLVQVRARAPAEALLEGESLPIERLSQVDGMLETCFRLAIHTWAGRSYLQLRAGSMEQNLALDVSPHPGKLGLKAYREMLAELSAISKDLPWGLGAGSHAASRADSSPRVVHANVIEAELPELLHALRALAADPLVWIERERLLETLPANRRVDPGCLRWLVTHPRVLGAVRPPSGTGGETNARVFIEQQRIRSTLNHPATRYLRHLLERLLCLLRGSTQAFQRISDREPRARAYARLLLGATKELEAALRRAPFKGIKAEPPGPTSIQAVIDHPASSRVHHLLQRLLDPGLQLEEQGLLSSGLGRTYELFELLGLYRLAGGLARALGLDWQCLSASTVPPPMLQRPPDGSVWQARLPGGGALQLRYQQQFDAWPGKQTGFHSLSGMRRPDYVLLLLHDGEPVSWLVLDAKYRASRQALHEGLADLHVYRDSLRWNGMPACAGFILVPRAGQGTSHYVAADYHQTHRFGALTFEKEDWLGPILAELVRLDPDRPRPRLAPLQAAVPTPGRG